MLRQNNSKILEAGQITRSCLWFEIKCRGRTGSTKHGGLLVHEGTLSNFALATMTFSDEKSRNQQSLCYTSISFQLISFISPMRPFLPCSYNCLLQNTLLRLPARLSLSLSFSAVSVSGSCYCWLFSLSLFLFSGVICFLLLLFFWIA